MIPRTLAPHLQHLATRYPALFLTGPRQSGKTTLARHAFPDWPYLSLEDLHVREEALEDPRGFLARHEGAAGLIIDEAQRAPELFSYLQRPLDEGRLGPVLLTGSQNFLLSRDIGQSLAGRTAILELLPFSLAELARRRALPPSALPAGWGRPPPTFPSDLGTTLFNGCFPAIHDRSLDPGRWLDGYVRTYVERDLRSLSNVGDLAAFVRFLRLCAGRAGQLLNASSLAADAGINHTTARRWLSILEASYVLFRLPPHFANFNKRLVKSPKLYFLDTGLLCFLLGLREPSQLEAHPLRGAVFENHVLAEIHKVFLHHGERPPLYFWRDSNGREVDVVIDLGTRLLPIEAKSGVTIPSDAMRGLDHYTRLSGGDGGVLIHGGHETQPRRDHLLVGWAGVS